MLTMENGFQQGRLLFALPGRADVESFKGNHLLIKKNKAQLIECGLDIANVFDQSLNLFDHKILVKREVLLEKEEEFLLSMLPDIELSIEEIKEKTKIPISKLNVLLMSLILKKVIKEFPGKIFKKHDDFFKGVKK